MKSHPLKKIAIWSAVALVVPLLGDIFVDGWNWQWSDFLVAWIFFMIVGASIVFAVKRVSNPKLKWLVGAVVFFCFALIWARFATG